MPSGHPLEVLPRVLVVVFGSLGILLLAVGAVRFRRWVHKRGHNS